MARSDRTARIAASVELAAGAPGLADKLSAFDGSALHSLLLHVFRERATRASPSSVLAVSRRALHQPSSADARLLHRFDALALAAAEGFEAVDLSPVLPFGACAALAGTDQNNVLRALRAAEVVADPTVAMALVAAQRRRELAARRRGAVRLCASARCVRTQPIELGKGLTPHFRLFALVTAGRALGAHRFEIDVLLEHLRVWLRLATTLAGCGFRIGPAQIEISDTAAVTALLQAKGVEVDEVRAMAAAHRVGEAGEALARRGMQLPGPVHDPLRVLEAARARLPGEVTARLQRVRTELMPVLASEFPGVSVRFDLSRLEGLGYYSGPMLRVRLPGPPGLLPLVDGGFTPWTQELLSDRKERFLASAIGSELLCKLYRDP